jgi:hypothetical protein
MNNRDIPLHNHQDSKMKQAMKFTMKALLREGVVEEFKDPHIFGNCFMIEQPNDGKIRLIYD